MRRSMYINSRKRSSSQDNYEGNVPEAKHSPHLRGRTMGDNVPKAKHPPHLRGRAIGMFYARRSRENNKNKEPREEEVMRIFIDVPKVSNVLEGLKTKTYKDIQGQSSSASPKSSFMWKYWTHLHESKNLDSLVARQQINFLPRERNVEMDRVLMEQFQNRQHESSYRKMCQLRSRLPVYEMRQSILNMIEKHQVILLSGETGCGKTTQVPQFVLDHFLQSRSGSMCKIVCTQPRRISAISVAERVAQERNVHCEYGSEVGYQIRLESKRPRDHGSILYCTTGVLLQWLQDDPFLVSYTHIFVDEVHERDLLSDFLLIVLKDLLPKRPALKLILMSATLDSDSLSKYFWDCPSINIKGFTYPVEVFTLEDALEHTGYDPNQSNAFKKTKYGKKKKQAEMKEEFDKFYYNTNASDTKRYSLQTLETLFNMDEEETDLKLVLELLRKIDSNQKEGAILVFLTGWDEIKKMNTLLQNSQFNSRNYIIIPLHSMLSTVSQREVFDRPPHGVRKIVLATNIAETSITIDDIVYVIDCGKIKMTNFDASSNISTLQPEWVAMSNIKQRRGRAGRTQPGVCYHLISKLRMTKLDLFQLPEMLRTRLEEIILKIKILKLGHAEPFLMKAMQPPDIATINVSLALLSKINALDVEEQLTPLGYHLARLPMDPHLGKMILFGVIFSCLDPILSIAASLSFKDPFSIPFGMEADVDKVRKELAGESQSDHLMIAKVMKEWENQDNNYGNSYKYCHDKFLSTSTIKMISKLKQQFASYLHDLQFLESINYKSHIHNRNSENQRLVKAIICAGLYPNVAKILKFGKNGTRIGYRTSDRTKVEVAKKSVNATEICPQSQWLIFHQKLKSSMVFLHDSTIISPYTLLFFGGEIQIYPAGEEFAVSVDKWIVFKCQEKSAKIIKDLRSELEDILNFKINNPSVTNWSPDTKEGSLFKCIIDLLSTEHISFGYRNQPKQPILGSASLPGTSSTIQDYHYEERQDSETY